MKIKVKTGGCVGHSMCYSVAGDAAAQLFEMDDCGFNITGEREVPAELEDIARAAARACPEAVILIEE